MKGYTKEQIVILLSNPNVVNVKYGSQIEYKEGFKRWAVDTSLKHPEVSAMQIFRKAGFDESVITSSKARSRINYWKKSYAKKKEKNNIESNDDSDNNLDIKNNELLSSLFIEFAKLVDVLERNNKCGKYKS